MYKSSVQKFTLNNTSSFANKLLDLQKSCEGCFYICRTCNGKVIKNKVPCPVVFIKLSIEWFSKEFRKLRHLEISSCGKKNFIQKSYSYA